MARPIPSDHGFLHNARAAGRLGVFAAAVFLSCVPSHAQIATYTGHQIATPTGTLTFTWPGSSGALANYTEAGLRVTCPGYGEGQGCTGGPKGGGCCVPYGFSHGGWYFAGGQQQLVQIYRADGGALSALEFQAGDGVNGCATTGNGTTYLWALVYSGGQIVGSFDIDVPTGSYVGFTGVFDLVRVGGYAFQSSRDQHDPYGVQNIGLDNMRYISSPCPAFGAPASIYSCADGTNTFSISAFGNAPLSYQWQWQQLGDSGWTNIVDGANSAAAPFAFMAAGSRTPSLSRTGALSPGSVVLFRCVVSNACSTVEGAAAMLAVRPAPIIVEQPQDAARCLPGAAIFTVGVNTSPSDPGPFTYQWQRKSGTHWNNMTDSESVTGSLSPTLVWVTEDTASATFRCVIANVCASTISTPATVTFGNPPAIDQQPADVLLCGGAAATTGSAQFNVDSPGIEPVSYQWSIESPPGSGQFLDIPSGDTFVDPATGLSFYAYWSDSSSFTVYDLAIGQHSSAIVFRATVTSNCGQAVSQTATLTYCPADFDCSGAVTTQDLFSFLGTWFIKDPAADMDGSGAVTVQDLFAYLGAWFQGCH